MSRKETSSISWSGDRREFLKTAAALPAALAAAHRAEIAAAAGGPPAPPSATDPEGILPAGVRAVWDGAEAWSRKTATRGRIWLNGLWRWQPAAGAGEVPGGGWGFFKVPGSWPGVSDYMQKDSQTVFAHPSWKNTRLSDVNAAWYQREFTAPAAFAGQRITLNVEYLNSMVEVYVDGRHVGRLLFPGGELDLTAACRPGERQVISLYVKATPLEAVLQSYVDTGAAREVKGTVARRGLCGDITLEASPKGARVEDVRIETSVRKRELTVSVALPGLEAGKTYFMRVGIYDPVSTSLTERGLGIGEPDTKTGRYNITLPWMEERLWDLNAPGFQFHLRLTLVDDADRKELDVALPIRFGFREFWIDGRDFYLNGSRIFLSAVPIDNAQVSAGMATYDAACETLRRLKSFGINAVYTHNYGCQPGDHLGFEEILRAADDEGMLVAFTQPHFSHYKWTAPDAEQNNGYARHAAYYVRMAQNHPSVVMYSMSHNATGYNGDMDPDLIDGIQDPREPWGKKQCQLALRAESIVKGLDPTRIVYHHAGGNIGAMHTINFYPNFVPIQELSDWYEHWSTKGVKPAFMCEYGAPFTWDWAMYRGWYKGTRTWGSAQVPWEFCLAEWNAQFLGDRAYQISEAEKANLRWEARKFLAGQLWYRWDYPHSLGAAEFTERDPVFAMYVTDNWRSFRTWEVSGISPWEYEVLWRQRPGTDKRRKELKVGWDQLQRPGFSADYRGEQYEKIDTAYEAADWIPGAGAQSLIRNNGPLLAWLGGKAARFTSKDHNFLPGETVEKQIIVINNSRRTVTCEWRWTCRRDAGATEELAGAGRVTVETGRQASVPIKIELPATALAGEYAIALTADFGLGGVQRDSLAFHVMAAPAAGMGAWIRMRVALFDPAGETAKLLGQLGVPFKAVAAGADLKDYTLLIIGKGGLSAKGAAPDLARVGDGLRVLVFEQTAEALEQRLGFRVQEYGLRRVFARVPGHPALAGLEGEHLRDWRGEATILPPRRKLEMGDPRVGATAKWCGLNQTRLWRCGNRGNVASVLIEKPACGDFMPLVDGGFSLQYSPLLEYREGQGMILFCQMDVTGRSEDEPAAQRLVRNLVEYAAAARPALMRQAVYAGDPAGKKHLEAAGFAVGDYAGGGLAVGEVLVVGPGGGKSLAGRGSALADWLNKAGGSVLALGLDEAEAGALLPGKVSMRRGEHIAAYFEPAAAGSPLAGIGPADVHNRAPRVMPLVAGGAVASGDGVLARSAEGNVVFCQMLPWQFDLKSQGQRRTFRRASCLVSRLMSNMGVAGNTPLVARFGSPVGDGEGGSGESGSGRWLKGLYLDQPEEWDDPYRAFRW